jgi:cell division septum initiation protein DivIVA
MEQLNIVALIENNPITRLSSTYNNKLLCKIKEQFTGFEQQLFVSSFYCYLNYDKNIDFVVDLDDVWKWLGFSTKQHSSNLLEKNFKIDIDYKISKLCDTHSESDEEGMEKTAYPIEKAVFKKNGGQNIKKIFLTIKCFKSLCLKAQTKKASEIHEYYMKLEEVLQETLEQETVELKQQLEQKENIILQVEQEKIKIEEEKELLLQKAKREKQRAVEQAIIVQFPVNTECVYFGTIDNTNKEGEKLIKFGNTNDLSTRILDHRKIYNNFILVNAFRVQNKTEIENLIKNYPKIKRQIRCIEVNGKNKTEIIAYDSTNFTIEKLTKHIKEIIHSKTYSIDNFNRLIKRNDELENENRVMEEKIKSFEKTISTQNVEIQNLKEKMESQQKIIETINNENQSVYNNVLLPEDDLNKKFAEFVKEICIVRPDVEEYSVNLEGRYRLWSQVKPTKEIFHSLKNYLDTRFKPKRIEGKHGYIGLKLKTAEYKKTRDASTIETFIFQVCEFSDCGKILNSVLLKEYQKWKLSVNKELTDNDMKEIKDYLNASPYALKATVWTEQGSNEGYYGLSLKQNDNKPKVISSTGKKVYKKELKTDQILATWDSISKAAEFEQFCPAKMSRAIKNKTIFDDYYYSL